MKIETKRLSTAFDGKRCYVHARGLIRDNGFGIITTQKLELSGCDVFYGIEMMRSHDGGESFSSPVLCEGLKRRYYPDGTSEAMSDATPFYHKKTGKILLTGHLVWYGEDNALLRSPRPRKITYAVYDEEKGDFDTYRSVELPDELSETYFSMGAGCSQIHEFPSGDLLIPFYFNSYEEAKDPWHSCSTVAVMRCSFDGKNIRMMEIGNRLSVDVPRGLGEPSIVKFKDRYLLALRNDETGFVSRGDDGLHFDPPCELCFDDGESLGNYNTQQHWLVGGGKLWLVYTRRAGNNDHMFRHRAPLFIAEFDPARMCVVRDTEQIAVPERGARLGNFGCQSYSDGVGYVFASEWMQNDPYGWEKCAERGSDNSIFISKIIFNE